MKGVIGAIAAALFTACLGATPATGEPRVVLNAGNSVVAGAPAFEHTVPWSRSLAPVLRACLFDGADGSGGGTRTLTPRGFASDCVVPYINGLWLEPTALFRDHRGIAAQATDKLIVHPPGRPFPIFYPPQLGDEVLARLRGPLAGTSDVVAKPLPAVLPEPSLTADSLYNNVGLLYLPNAYVVPGGTFNEMYGWDTFFIIKGMLASIDHIMNHRSARIWSAREQAFVQLVDDPASPHHYRAFAGRLFQVAKGMVDNHIFEIAYYGGFVLNANRTYYLTRSQPPLFTREALAVLESARRHGFPYEETLAPYLSKTREGFVAPASWEEWISHEVLPAAQTYYDYWTDPASTRLGSASNPRVATVAFDGAHHPVYLYGTDGVGPAPEVARSTQPQNRQLYAAAADYFARHPERNPDRRFYNDDDVCSGAEPVGGCGDPTYNLTQDFYRSDRAMRASGYDLSGRFGAQGEWTMSYAPISLNVLLLAMAEDIDRMAEIADEAAPFGEKALAERRAFLSGFFARSSGGFGDRFAVGQRPDFVPAYAYPYATQFYLLWADVLDRGGEVHDLVTALAGFLGAGTGPQYGIPASLRRTGKQWDSPYAWAPVQFFAADGLAANGYHADAARVMLDWVAAVNLYFARSGTIIEKLDYREPANDPRVTIGYARAQPGFGWTNAVYMLFVNRLYDRL